MAIAGSDNIGTGWNFPVKVDNSGAAKVRSYTSEPFDFTDFPNGGLLWVSMNGEEQQTFAIPQGTWTAAQIVDFFDGIRGARVVEDNGHILITSEEDNPIKSAIILDAPPDLAPNDRRNAVIGLSLPLGSINGYGRGNIAYTRNTNPELVTEEETIRELQQALLVMLLTNPGEVPMQRSYGVGLWELLFEPINSRFLSVVQYRLKEGIVSWDSRITPLSTNLSTEGTKVFLRLGFAPRGSQVQGELLAPLNSASV